MSLEKITIETEKNKSRGIARKALDKSIEYVKKTKDVNSAIMYGFVSSLAANYVVSKLGQSSIASDSLFHTISQITDTVVYSAVSAGVFYIQKRRTGLSRKESLGQLARFGATGFLTSMCVYYPARWFTYNQFQSIGMERPLAEVSSQIAGTILFMATVGYLGKYFKYVTDTGQKVGKQIIDMAQNGFEQIYKGKDGGPLHK